MTMDAPTPSKPFKCTMCPLEYSSKQGLTAHGKNKHQNDADISQPKQLVAADSTPAADVTIDPTPAVTLYSTPNSTTAT